ncbi:MAG TPA: hypothetical protein VGI78_03110 [Acetobacteraceae bacterium]|jgi:hypothetical protein
MTRLLLLAGSAFALAGCADNAAPVPMAGTQFDGSYAGRDTLLRGVDFQCGDTSRPERIDVHDGQFAYPFPVSPPMIVPLPARIAMDGTLHGRLRYGTEINVVQFSQYRTDWAVLRGHITGTELDATLTTMRCVRHLTAQRSQTVGAN